LKKYTSHENEAKNTHYHFQHQLSHHLQLVESFLQICSEQQFSSSIIVTVRKNWI